MDVADYEAERYIDWIVGFVDGEGSFYFGFSRVGITRRNKTGFHVSPTFAVTQGAKSVECLHGLREFFGIGSVYLNKRFDNHKEHLYHYAVSKLDDLLNTIVPFFKKHLLKSAKWFDFLKFEYCLQIIENGRHLTPEGLIEVANVAQTMNRCRSRSQLITSLQHQFGLSPPVDGAWVKPEIFTRVHHCNHSILRLGWIAGFVDGEGCFSINFIRQPDRPGRKGYITGFQVAHEFAVAQGAKSIDCLYALKEFFGVGGVYLNKRYDPRNELLHRYVVRKRSDLINVINPFFVRHRLRTSKYNDFKKFQDCLNRIERNEHLNMVGLRDIVRIAETMNHCKPRTKLLAEISSMDSTS